MKHENLNQVKELFGKDSCISEELQGIHRIIKKIVDLFFIITVIISLLNIGIALIDFINIINLTSEELTLL